jgi:nucleoside-diphosphate-sugar epimerase
MTRRLLVTGASGRLGSAVSVALAAGDFTQVLTDLRPFPAELPPGARFAEADLGDADAILHFSGIPNGAPGFAAILAANITGLHGIYEAARNPARGSSSPVPTTPSATTSGPRTRRPGWMPRRPTGRMDSTACRKPTGSRWAGCPGTGMAWRA